MSRAGSEARESDSGRTGGGGTKPWESAKGRGGSGADALSADFVESLSYDTRLYAVDIAGSVAHARMLASVGLISAGELAQIEQGLGEIKAEIESAAGGGRGWAGWKVELEDVHMCIEAALIEKIGDAGRKLHTGRSRNDQVALDLRLYLREACCELVGVFEDLANAFEDLARRQGDVLLPSYTHLQRAQPSCVGAEAMAWWCMFERDEEFFTRLSGDELGLASSPLGSGAIAGSSLPLDRAAVARGLGLRRPTTSSIDATASRDEAMDFLYGCARTGVHLSRWAEQWIIYSSTEFGFLELAGEHTTGSSMMPQKRNPDMLELTRGRSGNLIGSLVSLLTICKGLPIGYNRDLQEDKRHVFAAFDTLLACLKMAASIVRGARFNAERILGSGGAGGLDRGFPDATALAEYLVTLGVPFRTAHQVVGSLVRTCIQSGRATLAELTLEEMNGELRGHAHVGVASAVRVDAGVYARLGSAGVVRAYRTSGNAGTGTGGYRDWLAGLYSMTPTHAEGSSSAALNTPAAASPASEVPPSLFGDSEIIQAAGTGAKGTGAAGVRESAGPELETQRLAEAYLQAGRSLDDLPYTPEFSRICAAVGAGQDQAGEGGPGSGRGGESGQGARPALDAREVFRRLQNLRKAGKLPRLGRQGVVSTPPRISLEEEQVLAEIVIEATGTLGQRDQLPYTPRFEAIVSEFNQRTARAMTPHDVWRLVAKLAK